MKNKTKYQDIIVHHPLFFRIQNSEFRVQKGVSIFLALMILFISLAIGLGISTILISQLKMIRGMGDSVVALYAADTGIEEVLYRDMICHHRDAPPCAPECQDDLDGDGYCDGILAGTISDTLPNGASYETEFYDQVAITESVGNYKGTKRAIEVTTLLKKVFITSQTYTSNLEDEYAIDPDPTTGLDDADLICQNLADATGLLGTFKAWLSDGTTSAANRFTHRTIPYALVDDTIIAYSWTDLTDGELLHAINLDENGDFVEDDPEQDYDHVVWTNTEMNGDIEPGKDDCDSWTDTPGDQDTGIGFKDATDQDWTSLLGDPGDPIFSCWTAGEGLRLYCFEQ